MKPTDTLEAKKLLNQNMVLAEQIKGVYLRGDCYLTSGIFYNKHSDYESAMHDLTIALELFGSRSDKDWSLAYARTQTVFGTIYHQQGDFATALEFYLSAEEITRRNSDYSGLREVLSKIGDCYLKLNQFDDVGIYARKNLEIVEKLTNPIDIASVYIDYGNWLNEIDKYEEGIIYYKKAGQLLEKANNQGLYHTYYYNYAFLLSRKEKYAESLVFYEKAYECSYKFRYFI